MPLVAAGWSCLFWMFYLPLGADAPRHVVREYSRTSFVEVAAAAKARFCP